MKKNVTICFRTNETIRSCMQQLANEQRMSVSAVIESLICRQLKARLDQNDIGPERRRYERKKVSLPAFITANGSKVSDFQTGTILDVSLGGIRFSLPNDTALARHTESDNREFSVIFTLPDEHRPIRVKCLPKQSHELDNEVQIGAAFADADFVSYQALQNYLH